MLEICFKVAFHPPLVSMHFFINIFGKGIANELQPGHSVIKPFYDRNLRIFVTG
jgi:hypothetical protein